MLEDPATAIERIYFEMYARVERATKSSPSPEGRPLRIKTRDKSKITIQETAK